MRNTNLFKIIAFSLAAAVTFTSVPVSPVDAGTGFLLPVAGVARALNEGKSAMVVKADKDSSSSAKSGNKEIKIAKEDKEFEINPEESETENKEVSSIKETAATTDPALITVGAGSVTVSDTISENEVLEESANLEVPEIILEDESEADGAEDGDESQEGQYDTEEDSFVTYDSKKSNTEEEDFSNLVIARVNDYVNVRSEPNEESEIVGKLYNKSVGDLLEEAGEWYKIKSGNCTGYVKGEYVVTGEEAIELAKEVGTRIAVVTTTTLYVRHEPSTESEVIGMVPIEDELLVLEEMEGWAKVSIEEGDGYVSTEFVKLFTEFVRAESKEEEERRLAKEEAERKAAEEAAKRAREKQRKEAEKKNGTKKGGSGQVSGGGNTNYVVSGGSGTGSSVASYALQFVGNPYVYGGSSLTNGTDCSGFVMSVYRNFGVNLPHSSGGDRSVGRDVGGIGNAQAGDIVCYSGHVGIYIGGGQIVHASTPSSGIKVSNAGYRQILAVRRIF